MKLPDTLVVHPNEVSNWVKKNLATDQINDVQYANSLQSVIMGHHVVRVPIGKDAALFFTKNNNSLQVYSYKWQAAKLTVKPYKGNIFILSHQSNTAKVLNYSGEKIIAQNVNLSDTKNSNIKSQSIAVQKIKTNDARTLIAQVWCWLTGGTWKNGYDGIGANGEYYMAGCDYTADEDAYGGDAGSNGNYGETPGNGINYNSPVNIGDGINVGGIAYGGGIAWVDVSQVDAHGGCGTDGTEFSDPSTGCSTANTYTPYQVDANGAITFDPAPDYTVQDPSTSIDEDPSAQELDDNNNNSGNEDNTDYGSYQPGDSWPTINTIIPKAYFVGFVDGVNCLKLAKAQIRKMGYQISDYGAAGQTFQMYTESGHQNLAVSLQAVNYLKTSITNGVPVIVGVDDVPGSVNTGTDNTTDHFIVIVGMGTEGNMKYFRFYDSSTNQPSIGTSTMNKLYFNENTGELKGDTQSGYGHHNGMHSFIAAQVRKSKKI